MAQPVVRPPVTYVSLVSNYPSPRAKRERKPLSEVLTPNQPAVLHLFTGFLLVSCDGPGLAETFATRLKLKDCTISYIGSDNDVPAWGQLGCNGFIVLDSSHSVVCRATTAYQQVGPRAAFGHVETLLSALIDKKSSGGVPPALPGPTIPAGETVRLHGLKSRADLNGTYGVCVQGPEGDPEGRCVVRLTDGTPLRIRMDNLTVISEPAGKAQGGGCGPGGCGEVAKAKDCGDESAEGCFDGGS
ncbi:hypothetical protein Ctob_001876 [Chrysochromulina tobinii]|uniref:Uncharacterized protein n=1 Tax=Chrysochromulina tobinii TaxID=1460289 RepID=A0A0M0JA89_9EUKA|nr:hypothetical protein Ctob_001876 [Chrysochromulina tobinii]|eukprot:KOO23143.1 hypothetical protein Ctob_001876 [Chrysochromulina sp. CCMP291]